MGKALYRKYRPTSLDAVVGQDQVTKPLREAIRKGSFSHAYLFTGPRGCGKTSVARIFAHEVNGFKYTLEDDYVDIIEIDAASNTGVDDIRDLREKAIIAPGEAKYKVYIIDEVHMLSKSAFNALLKILEEPPEHVIFLMATTNPEKVPVTVLSRAQTFVFKLADPAVMQAHLEKIAKLEKIDITPDAIGVIVKRGGGSFRDSISLLDQISNLSDGTIDARTVEAALGLPEGAKTEMLIEKYSAGDAAGAVGVLRDLLNAGTDPEALASALIEELMKGPDPVKLSLIERLFKVQAPFAGAKLLTAFLEGAPAAAGGPAARPISAPVVRAAAPAARAAASAAAASAAPVAASVAPAPVAPVVAPAERSEEPEQGPAPGPAGPAAGPAPESGPEAPAAQEMPGPGSEAARPLSPEGYTGEILAEEPALGSCINAAVVMVSGAAVDIYPAKKFDEKVLQRHLELLKHHTRGRSVAIHSPDEPRPQKQTAPADPEKAAELEKISDIMGGVEEEENADDPF